MASQLWRLSAREMAAGVAEGRFSAVDLADAALARVEDVNGAVNAICTLNPQARDEAAAADARLKSGAAPRPLEGVPFVVHLRLRLRCRLANNAASCAASLPV